VRRHFLENQARFNGLVALRFFASRRRFLRPIIERSFSALGEKRPIHYSGRKVTFTFRHNYLDLMAPSPLRLDKDYVYKRAVGSIDAAFLRYRNRPLQEMFFHVLSTLFLLYSYYQRGPLQSPSAAVNAATYFWHGPHRRRVHREGSKAPQFFQDVLYGFLVRTLHLTRTVSSSYRLPFLPIFRGLPKRPGAVPRKMGWRAAKRPGAVPRKMGWRFPKMGPDFRSSLTIARFRLRFHRVKALRPSL
jgi:hypothetical protein